MTGTSFIDRSLERVLGGQSGLPLLLTANWVGIGISSKFLVYTGMPLLAPSTSGSWALSRTAWRRRRAGPRSLMATCWRPEPFTGCIRAPEAQTAPYGCWVFPGLLEGGPHVECGRLQRLLAVLPPRLMRHQAMQRVEGSERGLDSLSQRFWPELASLKGSFICQFLLRARQGDPEK